MNDIIIYINVYIKEVFFIIILPGLFLVELDVILLLSSYCKLFEDICVRVFLELLKE